MQMMCTASLKPCTYMQHVMLSSPAGCEVDRLRGEAGGRERKGAGGGGGEQGGKKNTKRSNAGMQ